MAANIPGVGLVTVSEIKLTIMGAKIAFFSFLIFNSVVNQSLDGCNNQPDHIEVCDGTP
jgi:hypothetical protein